LSSLQVACSSSIASHSNTAWRFTSMTIV
jgi:hypothetical protein